MYTLSCMLLGSIWESATLLCMDYTILNAHFCKDIIQTFPLNHYVRFYFSDLKVVGS